MTLDGVERKLTANDLMICSAAKPMCIAGVYGGLDSGVSDMTTDVFIESAYFNPVWVRKTAKRFGLNTDSSFRFERGVDPDIQVYALKRAALLMKELAGGEIASEITDICSAPIEKFKVELDIKHVNSLIGKEIPADTIRTILGALDIKIEAEEGDLWRVAVPPYRVDVTREADLVEEILRIYGYNNIPVPSHVNSALSYAPKPDRNKLMNLAADFLTANGFTEIMSNSLTKAAYYEGLTSYKPEHCVKILNPLSNDLNVMRQTLLFNMLEAVQLNMKSEDGKKDAAVLYVFDSNAYSSLKQVKGYDWIRPDQINWHVESSVGYTERNGGKPLPSLAFFHIPFPEYNEAAQDENALLIGTRKEKACAPLINTGLYAAMLNAGDIMATFVGHDHVNDYVVDWKGILLCYGRFTGGNTVYHDIPGGNGARVIELTQGVRSFKTWERLEGGKIINEVNYPSDFQRE